MDFINNQHGLDYKYCPDSDAYLSFDVSGKIAGKFPRAYVVDPHKLWETRCVAAGLMNDGSLDYTTQEALKLKPTQTVFKIWEHHNADINQ